ncbi:hypothetical protein BDD43_2517 [Mucilaginibacter gracilis]|uniref:Uncharacterized protein n=1 Tax=Mucilaginibacter gracilis TaxID=423350 RepID=A0A495J146_9SPHI|nr:hypothetical protein [Mucilaginibacter gracilis]RKR82341.1 hypothetical protein BDD43_2517 [Mucilaginibacter gracilis]
MKKYISAFIIALTTITMVSCDKKADVDAVAATLPGIQLSSVGMFTAGPYALPTAPTSSVPFPVNTVQILFGATTTNKTAGAIDVFFYDNAASTVVVQTLHFNSFTAADSFNTPSYGSVSYTPVSTSYPNTSIYQGSILLNMPYVTTKYPLGTPFISGHVYNIKVTIYSTDYTAATASTTSSSFSVAKLFAIQ